MKTDDLGTELRALRVGRRLALGEAARRAGLSAPALGNWEAGRRRPGGPALGRLLDALEADARTRTRLVALADPAHARIALVHEPLGAPLHLGTMLRAMRLRAKSTQREVATSVGVSQAAVAQWEAGDESPSAATLQAALFALRASVEEVAAIGASTPGDAFPDDPEARFDLVRSLPHAVCEPMMLLNERDLWWRAAFDPAWDVFVLHAVAQRTAWYGFEGRMDEVASLARRAMRMTGVSPAHATPAYLTLAQARLDAGADPRALARDLGRWAEGLAAPAERAWTLGVQALALARVDEARAVRVARLALSLAEGCDATETWYRRIDLAEVHLRIGEPAEALEALGDTHRLSYRAFWDGGGPSGLTTRLDALLGIGVEPEPELLPTLRAHAKRTEIPLFLSRLARAERAYARFTRRRRTPASPKPSAASAAGSGTAWTETMPFR